MTSDISKNIHKYKYLFLDRDGVINVERPNDYAKNISEFVFEDKALEAIAILSKRFDEIFIVTNQRGVGRGKMTLEDLESVHNYMIKEIEAKGGRVSRIFFCTDLESTSINRKPNIGMGFKAKEEFSKLDFASSVMVGNSRSDIEFGNKLGMYTVLVSDKYPKEDIIYKKIDAYYQNLYKFAISI